MMKDAYYFPHDSTATDDSKMLLVISQLGLEGYGIYWTLIEHLRNQPEFVSELTVLKALAMRFNSSEEKYQAVVLKYNLFIIEDDKIFYSQSLIDRMNPMLLKRKRLSIAGKKGNKIRWGSPGDRVAIASKVKESIVNKSKVKDIKERGKDFYKQLTPYINKYDEFMIQDFFRYWSEPNKENTKMKYEMEKTWSSGGRLATWKKRQEQFNPKQDSVWDKVQ